VSGLSSQSEEDSASSSEGSASEDGDTGKGEEHVSKSDAQVEDSLSLRAEVMQVSTHTSLATYCSVFDDTCSTYWCLTTTSLCLQVVPVLPYFNYM
jgi:hypothetical protein